MNQAHIHVLLLALSLCSVAHAERVTHIADGQRFEFDIDTERIAISSDRSMKARLAERGFDRVDSGPFAHWTIARRAASNRTSVREWAAALSQEPGVFASPRLIDAQGGEVLVTPNLFVGFASDVSREDAHEILTATGAGEVLAFDYSGLPGIHQFHCATGDGFDVLARVDALRSHPSVRFAECDFVFSGQYLASASDPNFIDNWGLENTGLNNGTYDIDVDATEAWDLTLGAGITVVVFDGGVQSTHPDLNTIPGKDFTPDAGTGDPFNVCDIHGTTVAGPIAARRNNGLGSVGVAPESVVASARIGSSIVPCNGSFASQASILIAGLDWAQNIGARVTNFSLSFNFTSSALTAKFQSTKDAGLVHFVGAGNSGTSAVSYPATLPSVNTISGIDRNGVRANFTGGCLEWNAASSFGTAVDFALPGEDIPTTDLQGPGGYTTGDYTCIDGTSYSAPYAAGVAALVLSAVPTLTSLEVEQILRETALDLGPTGSDIETGFGLPKAYAAILTALERLRRDLVIDGPASVFTSWKSGQASPTAQDWTLTYSGNTSAPIQWSATVSGEAFVTVSPQNGVLDVTAPSATVSILLDPVGLAPGVHRAKIRFTHDGDADEAHEVPITLVIERTTFALGDSLSGAIDSTLGSLDLDSSYFNGTKGEKFSVWFASAPGNQKLQLTIRGPSGDVTKSFKMKAKLGKPSKKTITLLESGLHTLEVAYLSGTAAPYRVVTKRKPLPNELTFKSITKGVSSATAPIEFDFATTVDSMMNLRIESSGPLAPLAVALRTPSGALISPMGAPTYFSSLEFANTPLGEPGTWKVVITGAALGKTVTVRTFTPLSQYVTGTLEID